MTGGAQMDGFVNLVRALIVEAGIPDPSVFCRKAAKLPGYFRPHKEWDLVVVVKDRLLASIEFKSHIGSFGNNFNNRTEEALGNALDVRTAYREGVFAPSSDPWLGYLMLLEDSPRSTTQKRQRTRHFSVMEEFRHVSFADRYELLLKKLVRERLYDSACLVMSSQKEGKRGEYREPNEELAFKNFAASLIGKITGFVKTSDQSKLLSP